MWERDGERPSVTGRDVDANIPPMMVPIGPRDRKAVLAIIFGVIGFVLAVIFSFALFGHR